MHQRAKVSGTRLVDDNLSSRLAYLATGTAHVRSIMETAVVGMTLKSIAIAVFVKTPGLSPLKTRLAAEIGASHAEQFHRLATRCVEETLQELQQSCETYQIRPFWSVAEPDGRDDPLWSAFPVVGQEDGGLGERMHHVYAELLTRHDAVFLLGADSPQLNVEELTQAIVRLFSSEDTTDFVLGPANDGGFVFLGGKTEIPLEVWRRVPYSVPETAERFLEELQTLGVTEPFGEWVDVDVWEDVPLLLPALSEAGESLAKVELATWIQNLLVEREDRA